MKDKVGSMNEVWFGRTAKKAEPGPVRMADAQTVMFDDGIASSFISTEVWDLGLYFMEPGMDTIVFSLEGRDDGTADEWYGPSHEFYYILSGEFTISFDKDADKLRRKEGKKAVVRPGDVFAFPPGWKYQVQCSSKMPGSFFWGKSAPQKGVTERLIPPVKVL